MSDINTKDYLADIKIHNFSEDMSIYEAAMETCLLAESNWAYIVESTALDEYASYEHAINKGEIKEDALREADEVNRNKFLDKVIEGFKKIGSYIYGLFTKFIVNITNLFKKHQFLTSKDAIEREKRGLEILEKSNQNTIESFIVNGHSLDTFLKKFKEINEIINVVADNSEKTTSDAKFTKDAIFIKLFNIESSNSLVDNWSNGVVKEMIKFHICYGDNSGKHPLNEDTYKVAFDNFKNFKIYKAKAKYMIDTTKNCINNAIAKVQTLKKYENDEKVASEMDITCKRLKDIMSLISFINGTILSLLEQDNITCCKILLKLYNAGGKGAASKNSENKDEYIDAPYKEIPVNAAASYTTESIESLFGVTV